MLVLSRKIGEEIIIAGNIRVKVVAVNGNRVRLGIVAPEDVTVDREEIHRQRLEFFTAQASPESKELAGAAE
jgi:carbon storage regulator